jgi:putative DNA primase/helicase
MSPILGHSLRAQSSTTEAGIRQMLGRDALPVVFDEIESKDEKSIGRITQVLELMRQASSESGGSIFKGTTSGVAKQYRIRSCFCFCSIAVAAREPADESRITRVELAPPNPTEFAEIQALAGATTLNPEFCMRIQARAILMAGKIRESARVLSSAVAKYSGDSRTGQQYGAIAAGSSCAMASTPSAIISTWRIITRS